MERLSDQKREFWLAVRKLYRREIARRGRYLEEQSWVEKMQKRGALFAISHSGGKDSQAQTILVRKVVPDSQIVVIHAPLLYVEWEGALETAREDTPPGSNFLLAESVDQHGEQKFLLQWVLKRMAWPDISRRWCTSDFKTHVIERDVRRYAKQHGFTSIVEVTGERAQESQKRLQKPVIEFKKDLSLPGRREWYKYHPIKWLPIEEVFRVIRDAGKKPMWVYDAGMTRASCAFCVLASKPDLTLASQLAPELYAAYVAVEQIVNEQNLRTKGHPHTIKQGRTLEQFTGSLADPSLVKRFRNIILKDPEEGIWNLPLSMSAPAPRHKKLPVLRSQKGTEAEKVGQRVLFT